MAKRTYDGKVDLPVERSWDLWQAIRDQILQGFTPDRADYTASMDGAREGQAVGEDFADLRAAAELEGDSVQNVQMFLLRFDPKLSVNFRWFRDTPYWCYVSLNGEAEQEVLDLKAAIDRSLKVRLSQQEADQQARVPTPTPNAEPKVVPPLLTAVSEIPPVPEGIAKRTHERQVTLPAERNWDLWQMVDDQILQRVKPHRVDYAADMDGDRKGRAVAENFAVLRATAEAEGASVASVDIWYFRDKPKLTVRFRWFRSVPIWRHVSFDGESELEVLGWKPAMETAIKVWLAEHPAEPPPPAWWRRLLHQPNQWLLFIVGGAIAGLIVWWISTL